MKKSTIGQRNQLISIEHYAEIKNEFGEEEKTWTEFAPAWAKVSVKNSSETEESGRLNSDIQYRLIIGFIPGIDESMRIKWGDLILEITSAYDPDGMSSVVVIDGFREKDV